MDVLQIAAEIDRLAVERQALWSSGRAPDEVARIGRRLTDLYEQQRHAKAQLRTGGRTHADIVRQARVESELERLMTR